MIEPRKFVKFLWEEFDLVEVLASRYTWFTRAEFAEMSQDNDPDVLVQRGLLNYTPETISYSLHPIVRQLFLELTRQRHLSSGNLTQIHVRKLESTLKGLDEALRTRDWLQFDAELEGFQRSLESITGDVLGNLDVIRKFTSDYRCNPLGAMGSAKKRLATLGTIWTNQIEPLAGVFVPHGPVDSVLVQIEGLLKRAEVAAVGRPEAEGNLRHAYFRARALTRSARESHLEAIREVKPLHDAARRNELVASAASALITACFEGREWAASLYADRRPGQAHLLDGLCGIESSANEGEDRFYTPFSTDEARTLLVERFFGYRPTPPPVVPWSRKVEMPYKLTMFMVEHHLRRDLAKGRIEDVMAWLIATFPKASLKDVVMAYGWVVLNWGGRADPSRSVVNRKEGYRIESHPVDSLSIKLRSVS